MERTLQPELLDDLAPDHPDALHNRRDLRVTNAVMRNHAWMSRTLRQLVRPGDSVLEVGAGTGELGLRLARHGIRVHGLDLWPRPPNWPSGAAWHQKDATAFTEWDRYPVIIGNLIFHQFSDADLARFGTHFRHARVIVACEPARRRLSQLAYGALAPLFGANHVSLHDAHVSIAAGFVTDELPLRFGMSARDWDVRCTTTLLGAYRLVATRR